MKQLLKNLFKINTMPMLAIALSIYYHPWYMYLGIVAMVIVMAWGDYNMFQTWKQDKLNSQPLEPETAAKVIVERFSIPKQLIGVVVVDGEAIVLPDEQLSLPNPETEKQ